MIGVYNAHFDLRRYFMHTALDHEPKQELYNTCSVAVPPCVTYVHVHVNLCMTCRIHVTPVHMRGYTVVSKLTYYTCRQLGVHLDLAYMYVYCRVLCL